MVRDELFSIGPRYSVECIHPYAGLAELETATSDPIIDRLPGAAMTVTLANALHIVVPRGYGTALENLNTILNNTTAKRLKAVAIRGSVEEENTKALRAAVRNDEEADAYS